MSKTLKQIILKAALGVPLLAGGCNSISIVCESVERKELPIFGNENALKCFYDSIDTRYISRDEFKFIEEYKLLSKEEKEIFINDLVDDDTEVRKIINLKDPSLRDLIFLYQGYRASRIIFFK